MPQAEERLPERTPFDVYTMMLILAFLAIVGASVFIHKELQTHWYANEVIQYDDNDQPIDPPPHAVKLTYFNSKDPESPDVDQGAVASMDRNLLTQIQVTQDDMDEYEILTGGPLEVTKYPEWLNPLENPINVERDADNTSNIPDTEMEKMVASYVSDDDTTPEGAQDGGGAGGGGDAPPAEE